MPQSRSMPKSVVRLLLAFLLLLGLVGLGTTAEIAVIHSYRPVPRPPLPQTGSDAQLAMLLGGAALVLAGGLVVLIVRRRRG